jgi:NADP-reducing hydrogenase subunit HndD
MEKYQVNLTINNIPVTIDEDSTILDAAHKIKLAIPTLCDHPDLEVAGNCRVCVVELKGQKELVAACATPVKEGMQIFTNSGKVRMARKTTVELLLSEHNADCTKCYRNGNCELQLLASEYRIGDHLFHDLVIEEEKIPDTTSESIIKDDSKCIRCQRCVRTCSDLQDVGTFSVIFTGKKQKVSTFFSKPIKDVFCIDCGQCLMRCPTAALTERPEYEEVYDVLANAEKHTVITTTPAVRAAIGQELGCEYDKTTDAKIVAALKLLGFNSVLDYGLFSDLYILELCTEFLMHLKESEGKQASEKNPFITWCSPANTSYLKTRFPEVLPLLSSCKTPHQIAAAMIKTYFADKKAMNPEKIVSVSVSPCTANKTGRSKGSEKSSISNSDFILTTRELARMIRQSGIDINSLTGEDYDEAIPVHSGASILTELSGGTTEALIRTLYEVITGNELPAELQKIMPLRGEKGIKETTIRFTEVRGDWQFMEGKEIRFAVINGNINAKTFFNQTAEEIRKFDFVEMMVCAGGCIGGGGQPIPVSSTLVKARSGILYSLEEISHQKKAHENPTLQTIYREFLKQPGVEKAQEILHIS